MLPHLLVLFIFVPIIEIYLLLVVGNMVGIWVTLGLIILTAIIGTYLLRAQGLATLQKLQTGLMRGESPAETMLEGMFLLFGGTLLLTPGFFTDALGLACLIPPIRRGLIRHASRYAYHSATQPHPQQSSPSNTHHTTTIEGEYKREKH